ncbi:MAG: NAD-dependent epimerase/dehydratase family protein [bacterium]
MKVFVTGATGYIGFSVACAFRRAGHEVWGLARGMDKARLLTRNEICPVLGSMQDPDSFKAVAEDCSVIIHAAADFRADTAALDRETVQTLVGCSRRGACPKTLVYTSGVWVHGNTAGKLVDETTPLAPPQLVSWRPELERLVLGASGIKGIVIRPGCVYGRQGGLTGMWFRGASSDKNLRVVGSGNNRWAMVHVDDLADAYLRAAASGLGGEVFAITDRSRWSVRDMAAAVARAAEYEGEIRFVPLAEAAKSMGDVAECLALDQHVDARKAVRLLGWQPRHGGFVDEVEIFFESWKAAQSD